ncbi:Endonuclease/exonuclease/phosphatase [Radiomyces spectabilis]|uniref:Endonuclease/exonuclease/phosphatase n=1 Tax=Radiomyces spectabilis TaxID=64574 RepID=UPI00221FA55E|nr:Endonuclease/exonuclease/phosphatase [Radiomyces spectabilis]KAI8391237.1 Endonuclease/exonuclease/phosphatase [Radiomyces spectabilis]
MGMVPGYDGYFSFSEAKRGYSGVAVYVKNTIIPKWTEEGITGVRNKRVHDPEMDQFLATLKTDPAALDAEGRCIIMDLNEFILFNIYFPHAGEDRQIYKMDFHQCVRKRIDDYLKQGRQVVLVGDVNAAHEEIDHCDPKKSMKENNITDFKDLPHRRWVDQIIAPKGPLIDMGRFYHPGRRGMYTCWNTRLNARPANFGTRIDYVLASEELKKWFKYSDIQPDIIGSDHCPVYADFLDERRVDDDGTIEKLDEKMISKNIEFSALLAKNFPEFSNKQKKLSFFFGKQAQKPSDTNTPSPASSDTSPSSAVQSPSPIPTTHAPATHPSSVPSPVLNRKRKSTAVSPGSQKVFRSFFVQSSQESSQQLPKETESSQEDAEENIDIDSLINEAQVRQEAKQIWNSMFVPPSAPRCRVHNEPCKELKVNKKGPNQGRRFYICSRPVGPEDGPVEQFRCNFFQWKHERTHDDK